LYSGLRSIPDIAPLTIFVLDQGIGCRKPSKLLFFPERKIKCPSCRKLKP
jgi:hypothetical protein